MGILQLQRPAPPEYQAKLRRNVQKSGAHGRAPARFRQTCGSWLVQKGVPIQHVSKLLRHSDIRITDRVYAHLAPENTRTTVQVLEDTLSRSRFTLLKGGL